MAYLNFYHGICLEELRNVTNHSQDNWYPEQDSNQAPPELKSTA